MWIRIDLHTDPDADPDPGGIKLSESKKIHTKLYWNLEIHIRLFLQRVI